NGTLAIGLRVIYKRNTQNRVPSGVSVRPRPPVSERGRKALRNKTFNDLLEVFFLCLQYDYCGESLMHRIVRSEGK
ncbi:MAG: hypothetical protein K0Q87_5401, partial [Neobacillus sp.]|nr:hypothetical protein [Neobacillus sp.]